MVRSDSRDRYFLVSKGPKYDSRHTTLFIGVIRITVREKAERDSTRQDLSRIPPDSAGWGGLVSKISPTRDLCTFAGLAHGALLQASGGGSTKRRQATGRMLRGERAKVWAVRRLLLEGGFASI